MGVSSVKKVLRGWGGGHWCSLGVCSLPANPEDHCNVLFASVGTMYGFFFVKMVSFSSSQSLIELIYLFSFGHLVADGLIIVIRLPCLPSTSSLYLWSFKVWDCEPEWEEPPSGSSVTWGTDLGQGPQEEAKMWLWLLCLVVSDAWIPCPGPLRGLAGRGGGAGGRWFSFSTFWLTSSLAHQYLTVRHWIIDMGPCHSCRDSQLLYPVTFLEFISQTWRV